MADFNTVAQQFVQFYYDTFDANRENLAGLYRPQSMLTFEATPIQGASNIVEKLTSLPFQKVRHRVDTLDAQPSSEAPGAIMVLVTGALLVDEEQRPMNYAQVFQLLPTPEGSYYVFNDVFRLVYAAA